MKKIIVFIIAIAFASCSSDLENLNQNIKDPAAVPGESLFTGAQKNLADQMVDLNVNINNTKLWSQYLQETTYTDESNYDQTTRSIPDTHWSVLYKDVLKDLDEAAKVITNTTYTTPELEALKPNKLAIIEILNVFAYAVLIETYGDIPYTESLDSNNLLPKYDDGETTYKALITRLTTAINNLDTSKRSFDGADRIYKGDVMSWKKFAASLKLRMGILLADTDNAFAKSTVESAVSSGVFTSNSDNAGYIYLSADPNTNPIHDNLVLSGRHDFVAAKTIVDMMNSLGDYRISSYFLPTSDGTYVGGAIGTEATFTAHSQVTPRVENAVEPGIILDYAEVEFLLAEAAARTFNVGGTAKEHYDKAIKASFEFWNASNVDDYLAQPNVDYATVLSASTATTPWKEVIGNQKWLALFNRGLEAWTSIRLLDFPIMAPAAEAVSGYPNRYTYPVVEQTLNPTNYNAAATAIGGDLPETKLFWDKY
ncbi:SusD/RagB family nutrient-binding outer membrane lipoprotein [Lutibacter sp. HS1-25]|uniref:SusD/RagB family nutrient-binding outer membrane lipoprotein n=1 Tax=Lutibacter sp. HS1-25 TaxID=2485000 RepID=UPI0010124A5A|nr:SusD/RagB family nutrient-binding outer membrane lipoprotein [Lutibacter sp. HS1-25]RXP58601.1 SusD/RagB family nutrient-binding outer membrane lipoprotein [Lutibacter sp. HS1-25]